METRVDRENSEQARDGRLRRALGATTCFVADLRYAMSNMSKFIYNTSQGVSWRRSVRESQHPEQRRHLNCADSLLYNAPEDA